MRPTAQWPLLAYNTLGVRSSAEYGVIAHSSAELIAAAQWADAQGLQCTPLGGGSNVIPGATVPGLVVMVRSRGIQTSSGTRDTVLVTAQAGENWHELVRYSLGQGLNGLQCLALIPGCVGAAPIQNIGAYGSELADCLVHLSAYDRLEQRRLTLTAADCRFGYRDSLFKSSAPGRFLILDVTLQLQRQAAVPKATQRYADINQELSKMGIAEPTPTLIAEAVCRVRRRKLPDTRRYGNVGSVFKNPVVSAAKARQLQTLLPQLLTFAQPQGVRLSAAQLIDRAGGKDLIEQGAAVWHRQPLVLIQRPQHPAATSQDFCALLEQIQNLVAKRFDLLLETEPQRLGIFDPEPRASP